MRRARITRSLFRLPLGHGAQAPRTLPSRHVSRDAHADVSLCKCVAVVKRPQIGLLNGLPVWQCQLAVTQVGVSVVDERATSSLVLSQEVIILKCIGDVWVDYCRANIGVDSLVSVAAQLVQRPKYVAIHSAYRYDSELHVTESIGGLALITSLKV